MRLPQIQVVLYLIFVTASPTRRERICTKLAAHILLEFGAWRQHYTWRAA